MVDLSTSADNIRNMMEKQIKHLVSEAISKHLNTILPGILNNLPPMPLPENLCAVSNPNESLQAKQIQTNLSPSAGNDALTATDLDQTRKPTYR